MHTRKRTGTYADTQQASLYSGVLTMVVKKIPASWNVIRRSVVNSDVWKEWHYFGASATIYR